MGYKFNPFTGKLDAVTPAITKLSDLTGETISATPVTGEIVRYDGTHWVNGAPSPISAGAGVNIYPTQTPSDLYGTTGYFYAEKTPAVTVYMDIPVVCNNNKVFIVGYITDTAINLTTLDAGIWTIYGWGYASLAGHSQFVVDFYERTSGGVETLLFSMVSADLGLTLAQYVITILQPQFTLAAGSRGVVKVNAQTTNTSDTTVHACSGDSIHVSYINTPLAVHHNELPGLQGGTSTQYYHMTAAGNVILGNTSGVNTGNETATTLGATLHATTAKIPVTADEFGFWDSVSGLLEKVTWANIKATLLTYFNAIYVPLSRTVNGHALTSNVTVTLHDLGLDNLILLKEERVFRSLLTSSSFFQPVSKTAYFVYLGQVTGKFNPLFVEFYVSAVGTIDDCQVGFFTSDTAPMKRDQVLTLLDYATVDAHLVVGVNRNTDPFRETTHGRYLWAGLRMACSVPPRVLGLIRDFGEGFLLYTADSVPFGDADTFNGEIITPSDVREGPDLRLTLD
jgi:hypothetical protein